MTEPERYIDECEQRTHLLQRNQFVLEQVDPDHLVIGTAIRPEISNIYGIVHGGSLMYLADVTAGLTALTDGRHYVTQNTSAQFLGNTDHGSIHAEGTVLRRGRSMTSVRVEIRDDGGRLMLESLFSMFTVDRPMISLPEEKK